MSNPFLGEIKLFAGNFAPVNWALCNGQLLAISENDALFSLLGTTYGGDGQTTFALPDLRSRVPISVGTSTTGTTYTQGQSSGSETVTLLQPQMPTHSHPAKATSAGGSSNSPTGQVWASSSLNQYAAGPAVPTMNAGNLGLAGGSQPHANIMPLLAVNYIIALAGIYPSLN